MSRIFMGGLVILAGASLLLAQESGPKAGKLLPGPFDCYNLNGEAKGRQHCLVCEFGLRPSVLVFARDVPKEKEGALGALFKRLDEAIDTYKDQELRGGVVFLSPDARSSATATEMDPDKLVEEAKARDALYQRLEEQAKEYKNILFGVYPIDGPVMKTYSLDAKAAVTVLVYNRLRVLDNFAFAEGALGEPDVAKIMEKVQQHLKKK